MFIPDHAMACGAGVTARMVSVPACCPSSAAADIDLSLPMLLRVGIEASWVAGADKTATNPKKRVAASRTEPIMTA